MSTDKDAVLKGFERWIEANTINSGGKNNTVFDFTMNISGASAAFKKALSNGELLLNGQATVISGTNTAGSHSLHIQASWRKYLLKHAAKPWDATM